MALVWSEEVEMVQGVGDVKDREEAVKVVKEAQGDTGGKRKEVVAVKKRMERVAQRVGGEWDGRGQR